MEKTFKRLLSLAIALVMVLGMIPVTQIEAKAETTTVQAQTQMQTMETYKSAAQVNETQQNQYSFTGVLVEDDNTGVDGEIQAICPHCSTKAGKDVIKTWVPIPVWEGSVPTGKSSTWSDAYKAAQLPAVRAGEEYHYYVPQNKDADGVIHGVTNNSKNAPAAPGATDEKSYFFLYLMENGSACLHLNGSKLTTASHGYVASGTLNVMGDGVWQGKQAYGKLATHAWRGSTLHVHGNAGAINIYSGTIQTVEASDVGQPVVSLGAGGNNGKINIHKDAVINGTVWGNVGTITLNGGTINGQVVMRGGNSVATEGTTSYKPVFTMNGGTINGAINPKTNDYVWPYVNGRGGAIFAAGAEVNINGGIVNGVGTEAAPNTADGGAIFVAGYTSAFMNKGGTLSTETSKHKAASAKLNITGGTINGGVLENANGSAIYAAAADLLGIGYSSVAVDISGGTINGGKVTDGNGGAVYVSGILKSNPVTTLTGGTVNGGTVVNGNGGAFYITDGGGEYKPRLDMSAGTINGGTVTGGNGGAVAGFGANLNLYGGTISGGTVTGGNGGAVSLQKGVVESILNATGGTVQNGKAIPVVTYTAETETTKATGGLGGNIYLNNLTAGVGTNDEVENKVIITGGEAYRGGNIYNTGKQITIRKNAVISYGKAKTYSDDQEHTATDAQGGNVYSAITVACYGEVAYGTAASHGGNLYIGSASGTFNEGANIHHGTAGGYGGNIYNEWKLTLAKDTIVADGTAAKGGNIYYENNSADTYNLTTPNPNNGMNFSGVITRGTATTGAGGNIYSNHKRMNMNILAGEVSDGKCTGTDADEARGGNIYAYEGGTVNIGNDSGDAVVISGGEAEVGGSIYAKNLTVKKTGTVKDGKARVYGGNIAQAGGPVYIYGTVQDGKAGTYGGNMAVAGGYLVTIDGGQILRGEAETYGGNINSNNSGILITGNALVDGGVAKTSHGGNIKIFGGTAAYTKLGLQVDSGTISNGKAENGSGGNIIVFTSGTNVGKITVNGGTISGGIAKQGGNIFLDAATSANINGGTISGGSATGTTKDYISGYTGGGNIYMSSGVPVTVANATISGGIAASSGGNFMVQKGAILTLNDGTVVSGGVANGTIAPSGGGNIQTSAGTVNINVGATVSGGTAPGGGTNVGVIYGGVLNLNGGVIGASAEQEAYTVRIHTTDSAVNVVDGTVYGLVKLTDTAVATDITIRHGQFTMDPTGLVQGEGAVAVLQTNGMYGVHVPGEGTANPAPSCSAAGQTDWTCSYTHTVGETTYDCAGYSVAEGQLEHDWADATCTAAKTCKTCGETEGEANGHDWADATCTAPKTCKTCGETEGEANGHDWADATCTAPKTCKTCGETEGEAKGHAWNDATCTAPKTCGTCGETEGEANGHDWADATCTAAKTCKTCGETEGEAAGHKLTLIPEVPAQVNKPGAEAYYQCDVCAKKFSDAEGKTEIEAPKEIPALPEVTDDAKVGDTAYATLAEAVAAANAVGGQVDLQKDVEVSVLVELATNVVLNLNGHKLTVKENGSVTAIYNDSAVIDTSEGREGRLVVEEGGKLYLPKENRQLPVDMGNGLMFVNVAVNHGKGSINGYQTWIDGMDKELAEALKTKKASELGLKFQVVLTWGNSELVYTFSDETVSKYAADWQTYAMYLKVSGAEGLNLQYKFQIAYTGISTAKVAIDTANEIAH